MNPRKIILPWEQDINSSEDHIIFIRKNLTEIVAKVEVIKVPEDLKRLKTDSNEYTYLATISGFILAEENEIVYSYCSSFSIGSNSNSLDDLKEYIDDLLIQLGCTLVKNKLRAFI